MPPKKKTPSVPAAVVTASPIIDAVKKGDLEAVQKLTKDSPDLEVTDVNGNTALLLACGHYSGMAEDVVKFEAIALHLINSGASVSAANAELLTPIHLAKTAPIVAALIAKGANAEALTVDGLTPLGYATATNNTLTLVALVRSGVNINAVDSKGNTALHIAASTGGMGALRFLADKKQHADIRVKNKNGHTAFDIYQKTIKINGNKENETVTELLTGKRARDDNKSSEASGEAETVDSQGNTPLIIACKKDDNTTALKLIAAGANVKATNKNGETPLHFTKNTKVAKALVAKGANIEALTNGGHTPLRLATHRECGDSQDALLDAGADVNAQGPDGRTALHIAAASCMWWIIKPLTRTRNLDTSIEDNNGETALDVFEQAQDDVDFTCEEERDKIYSMLE